MTIGSFRAFGAIASLLRSWSGAFNARSLHLLIFSFLHLFILSAFAQAPRIGGNVYGGGNQADVDGSTKVTIVSGDIGVRPDETAETINKGLENPRGKVFGGARMANVGGNTFVNIDADNDTYVVANYVYGGNDIAGTVGTAKAVGEEMPAELTDVKRIAVDETDTHKNAIDDTWNSYVHISSKVVTEGKQAAKIYIGQLFAGGNGDYFYDGTTSDKKTTHNIYAKEGDKEAGIPPIATRVTAEGDTGFTHPELLKTYLEVKGGSIVYAYGGGNNATVKEEAVIHVDNPTQVVNDITDSRAVTTANSTGELLTTGRFLDMGINMGFSYPSSAAFQIGRFFGGNNRADMAIRPKWNLRRGKIRNLYSGGNQGNMTHPNGIFLEIPEDCFELVPAGRKLTAGEIYYTSETSDSRFVANGTEESTGSNYYGTIVVDNVYGGCRMADVRPMVWDETANSGQGAYKDVEEVNNDVPGTKFPRNLAARVLIKGGDVNNVYGGNDVRGKVYFGNAIGIYTSVRGNVYGGGNGAYPYTDNPLLKDDPTYSDLYYNPVDVLAVAGITGVSEALQPVTALNEVRPNAEQVSILLRGKEDQPTIIHGSVYVGGNCATLKKDDSHKDLPNYPLAELKMGSHVLVENVFLGNNGEGMVTTNEEERPGGVLAKVEGVLRTYRGSVTGSEANYNSMDLKADPGQMFTYMQGVSLDYIPRFILEDTRKGDPENYQPYTSYVGSLYYGGNRGSMTYAGTNNIEFEDKQIYIYNKLVAGCNNGNVKESDYNAAYEGGILGAADERGNKSSNTLFYTNDQTEGGTIKDRIVMDLSNIKMTPKRWDDTYELVLSTDADIVEGKLKAGEEYFATPLRSTAFIADGTETVASPATYYRLTQKGSNLGWNTAKWNTDENGFVPIRTGPEDTRTYDPSYDGTEDDEDRRLLNGNIYGGCYTSGHVNGNVIININDDVTDKSELFVQDGGARNSGVDFDSQAEDVMTVALTLFGAGKGKDTEIWGSTTVNHNNGYCFQIFGGGEEGIVGKFTDLSTDANGYNTATGNYVTNGKRYQYDERFSTHVNLMGANAGYSEESEGLDLAEADYLYGAGNRGEVCGNSYVHLGNGRIYDAFGGASNAEILGGTEVHIGCEGGFPWIRDNVYGGNDFGGTIRGAISHWDQVRKGTDGKPLMFKTEESNEMDQAYALGFSSTFVQYIQGRVDSIFGGCYGEYDYADPIYKDYTYYKGETGIPEGYVAGMPRKDSGFSYPHLDNNSFVLFKPADNSLNQGNVGYIFGGSEGFPGHPKMNNTMQEMSYVLIDDYDTPEPESGQSPRYGNLDVYGGGSYAGLGTMETVGGGRSVVDLYSGHIRNVYGGSNNEGLIGYTRVNVPKESTIKVNAIFGGGKGYDDETVGEDPTLAARFCDHYVTCVDYQSENAIVADAIYGGNQNRRIAFDTYVNIEAPVYQVKGGYTATIYGGGHGTETVSGRTNIYMNKGSDAYKVFGGGRDGDVFNFETLKHWLGLQFAPEVVAEGGNPATNPELVLPKVKEYGGFLQGFKDYIEENDLVKLPQSVPNVPGYDVNYVDNIYQNTGSDSEVNLIDPTLADPSLYYNTNVHIMQGGNVNGYAYGGGLGQTSVVSGSTYVGLEGGKVDRDIYGGGQGGVVFDEYGLKTFTATTNVFAEGGMARNVYGGGYLGHVGKHVGDINTSYSDDIPAVANVTIGIPEEYLPENDKSPGAEGFDADFNFHNGVPAIMRNAYGGGEGGSVFGTTNLNILNGYIGYRYKGFVAVPEGTKLKEGAHYYTSANGEGMFTASGEETSSGSNYYKLTYAEELDDKTPNAIELAGNAFGGGYVVNSYVDNANVTMYGGTVRGSLYGGGEVGPIGRGTVRYKSDYSTGVVNNDARIFKAGLTHVRMFNGLVKRNVFGGGRGKDSWGGDGTMFMDKDLIPSLDLDCKGYVFGQTEVDILGGEVGTDEGLSAGYGNVFGGGDEGRVYSAYELANGTLCLGKKPDNSERYDDEDEGYYYMSNGTNYVDNTGTALADGAEKHKTEDCKVLVEPWLQVKAGETVTYTESYSTGDPVPASFLFFLNNNVELYPDDIPDILAKIDPTTHKATDGFSFTATYGEGDYVPTAYLNTLSKKVGESWPGDWSKLDAFSTETAGGKTFFKERGVIIHNAVFAGGNMPPGGGLSANTKYVFGNATATIHDVYHRDLVTIGTGHTGGLYGDGNLTLVDGYRGLNITNYGTDFYGIDPEITIDKYNVLPPREKAYYELRYRCVKECRDKYETVYKPEDKETGRKASTITTDELELLFVKDGVSITDPNGVAYVVAQGGHWIPNPALTGTNQYWEENGVCSRYAGRIMNTIQRADFCGVFGSRMVMQGARDRVPEEVDYTNYTINRVREVSLNKKESVIAADLSDASEKLHGNYFGIYSQVNFLGALTSDVDFESVRTTESLESRYKDDFTLGSTTYHYGDADATFYNWKNYHHKDRLRNNGSSHNLLALASGVYLELTSEKGTGKDLYEKDWGLITGVVELDLINVQPGMGGGFVYAKNVHGDRISTGKTLSTLTELNRGAVTNKFWDYKTTDSDKEEWQVSGNFVNSTQTIIDDCYNKTGKYLGDVKPDGSGAMPAHYWYIKGQVYVYDQYISAYTGSPNAYSETVEMPLTISSTAYGKLTLKNVQPNLYAYYSNSGSSTPLGESQKLKINSTDYQLNDPIDFWEWWKLSPSERELFVPETMVSVSAYKTSADGAEIAAGQVKLPADYNTFKTALPSQTNPADVDQPAVTVEHALYDVEKGLWVPADEIFRSSNNLSHDKGYILTYEVDNPNIWNKWYTEKVDSEHDEDEAREKNQTGGDGYEDGPTYRLKNQVGTETITEGKVLGQREYEVGEVIPNETYDTYNTIKSHLTTSNGTQAKFEAAYIVTGTIEDATNISTTPQTQMTLNPGVVLAKSQFTTGEWPSSMSGKVEQAYVCTSTLQVSSTEFVTVGTCMTAAERDEYIRKYINTTGLNERINTLLSQHGITAARITEILGGDPLDSDDENALGTDLYAVTTLLTSKAELTQKIFVPAYYCTSKGNYGGDYYKLGNNYRGLQTWSGMSEADRQYFTFNYDALNLLVDPTYPHPGSMNERRYQYDGKDFNTELQALTNPAGYSLDQAVDYIATFQGKYRDDDGTEKTVSGLTYPGTTTPININDQLTPQQYEALPNEKRHYAQISVTAEKNSVTVGSETKYRTYVVRTSFVNRDGPYAVGQTLTADEYNGLASEFKTNVTELTFNEAGTYYFCREEYTVGEHGEGQEVSDVSGLSAMTTQLNTSTNTYNTVSADVTGTYNISSTSQVPIGLVISSANYTSLVNKQLGFSISGTSPKELSTLYVTRESDIKDLSQEKIITVVYQYNYEESNESGTQITPVSEYHVLNIHINFKSGIPFVDDITPPDIVLPGYGVTIKAPNVTPGAYEVIGRGWELFSEESYAENHTNGVEYTALTEPLYWYQDGYYIAYYAKTFLGKTYSNYVPVRVANYHDLKKVMDDKEHHLHVDYNRAKLKRDSKIYINNYTTGDKDGLDLLKDFYDLSLVDASTVTVDSETGVITTSGHPFAGHAPLNISETQVKNKFDNKEYPKGVKAGTNLEFYLRTDIDHTYPTTGLPKPWTTIGTDDVCFKGNLHGDGHHLSGLTNSLFYNLCGSVYNLGVSGSFNTAGVVDKGIGYVESCWTQTSATTALSTPPNAVFGNPTYGSGYQLVNSYFLDDNKDLYNTTTTEGIITSGGDRGKATAKSAKAYYNGELAYDLNNFYLYKRYNDNVNPSGTTTYKYYKPDLTDPVTHELIPQDGTYATNEALCSSGYNNIKYVEERFADGDFRYAAGTIPGSEDVRYFEDENASESEKDKWYPIWPDDYLFFGQKLTYGHSETDAHQDVPTAIARSNGRLSQNTDANRVYRAPAYFRPNTKEMSTAYFNPEAYLLAKSSDGAKDAYPGMTAIDFRGHYYGAYEPYGAYGLGNENGLFYTPLLDDDGLTSIMTRCAKPAYSETQNLLVYAPARTSESGYANEKTFDVLTTYFKDPEYSDYYDNTHNYRLVGRASTLTINGHIVQDDLTATNDHLLVDKQDFSAPIGYQFDGDHLMWYQRVPERYIEPEWSDEVTPVRTTKGWEGVSLPFTAELVTTQQKGEITHFYDGSEESKNGTHSKVGHEYWLRQYRDISDVTGEEAKREARFTYPTRDDGTTKDKTVTNTFLWDYYYEASSGHDQQDYNTDEYLKYQQYYNSERTYSAYAPLTVGTPYIIGFPGSTYYEFDLSGTFHATTTADPNPARLAPQTITFASAPGVSIGVSYDELANAEVTKNGYTFKPSYLNDELPAGTYVLNSDGNAYHVLSDAIVDYENDGGNTYTAEAFAAAGTLYTDPACTEEATSWVEDTPYFKKVGVTANKQNKVSPQQYAFRPYFNAVPGGGAKEYKGLTRSIVFSRDDSEIYHQDESDDISKTGNLLIRGNEGRIFVTSTLQEAKEVIIVTASGALVDRYTIQPGETRETRVTASGVYLVNKKKISMKVK